MKLNLKNATLAALLAVVPAMPVALALYGFYVSRGGEPLLGRRILDRGPPGRA